MRQVFVYGLAAVAALYCAGTAEASTSACDSVLKNIVVNCGFESPAGTNGSFNGWTITGNLEGGVPNAPTNNYIYIDNANPHTGNADGYFGAQTTYGQTRTDNTTGPLTTLSQTLPLLNNEYYSVSFYIYNSGCANTCTAPYYEYFDAYFDGIFLTAQVNQSTGSGYKLFTFLPGTGLPSQNNGILKFDFVNDDAAFQLDDVVVTAVGPTPEPATLLLALPVLALLYWVRRKKIPVA